MKGGRHAEAFFNWPYGTFHTEHGLPRADQGKVELVEIRGTGVVAGIIEKLPGRKDIFVLGKGLGWQALTSS